MLPDERQREYIALGKVTVYFASLEFFMSALLSALIRSPLQEAGYIIGSEMPFNRICSAIQALSDKGIKDPKLQEQIRDFVARACKVEELRNRCIHSFWREDKELEKIVSVKVTAKMRRGLHVSEQHFSVEDLEALAKEIVSVVSVLFLILTDIHVRRELSEGTE